MTHRHPHERLASTAVSNALNGHGLHTDDTSGFRLASIPVL